MDLNSSGAKFTQDNKRKPPNHILERLDKYVANSEWITAYPDFKSHNLDYCSSDHQSVTINTNPSFTNNKGGRNKFFNFNHNWLLEEDYKELIKRKWSVGNPYINLPRKLQSLSLDISDWASSSVGSIAKNIRKCNRILIKLEKPSLLIQLILAPRNWASLRPSWKNSSLEKR